MTEIYKDFIKWKNEKISKTKHPMDPQLFTNSEFDFVEYMLEIIETDEKLKKMMLNIGNKTKPFEQIAFFYKDNQREK